MSGGAAGNGNRKHVGLTLAEYAEAKRLPVDFLKNLGLSQIPISGQVAVKIPYLNEEGTEVAVRFRFSMDPGQRRFTWRTGSKPIPYGLWRLADCRKEGYVCIVEGESDPQTLWHHGIPALGLPGASSWKEGWAAYLDGIEKIYLNVEPDRGGETLLRKIAVSGIRNRVRLVKLQGAKDPSELYLRNPEGFRLAWKQALASSEPWSRVQKEIQEKLQSAPDHGAVPYEFTPAGIIWHKPTRDGEEDVHLTNFNASIIADTSEDDGVECHRRFEIEATLGGRSERFELPANQFGAMNWVAENIGALAVIFPPPIHRDHARAAIQLLSQGVKRRKVYGHIGWRRLGKRWAYLHASGAITATGLNDNVRVKLPDTLKNFRLPDPPEKDKLKAAVRASLHLLDVAGDDVSVPLYAGIWRAPLGKCDFTLHVAGPTGVGKTELAALCQQHFGKKFDSRNLAAGWSGTANSLEVIAFSAKDALLVVDDFAPQGSLHEVSRTHRDADRLIRAQGNNAGRSRLRSDATLRPTKSPRGLILSTGEDVPHGHSTRARMLVVELEDDGLDWERLTACQADAQEGLYERAFAGYLKWFAGNYDWIHDWFQPKVAELRTRASKSAAHKRTPDIVAQLAAGLLLFLRFAKSCGALSKTEAKANWRRFWSALGLAAARQREYHRSEEPTARFMELVDSLLSSGSAHLANARDGWTPKEAKGHCIGWFDGNLILLEPEAAFAAAQRLAREQGDALSVGAKTLWKRMKERGLLARQDEDRNLWAALIMRKRRRVLALKAKKLPVSPELHQHWLEQEYPET